MFFIHELQKLTLAHHGVRHVQPRKFVLVRWIDLQLFNKPIVQRPVRNKFERTNAMGYVLNRIALSVCEIIHRVNTPFIPGAVMMRMFDAVHQRIAHVHVRMGHVNFGAQYLFSVFIFPRTHVGKHGQVFFHRSVSERTVCAGCCWRSFLLRNFFTRAVIHISESLFN